MGRTTNLLAKVDDQNEGGVDAEVEKLDFKPEEIPEDVWELVQDNGRMATERLNDILNSPKFMRLRPSDQARFIKLAQDRAYGTPRSNSLGDPSKGRALDATLHELQNLVERSALPEYRLSRAHEIDDAEEI